MNFLRDDLGDGFQSDVSPSIVRCVVGMLVTAGLTMKSISPKPSKASLRNREPSPGSQMA